MLSPVIYSENYEKIIIDDNFNLEQKRALHIHMIFM